MTRAAAERLAHRSPAPHALARTRTATPCGTTPSRWRVYQFHHQGIPIYATEPTGLEPATSRVTVECSNQTELRLLARLRSQERLPIANLSAHLTSPFPTLHPHVARRGIEPLSAP